ncbi:VOC family protein [Solihabitans fulvus]|uniref:VOC family protein n=1 Tax=Solihabitans fulvus TaxID=1892852 RepID=A0A5B2WNW7_9PSEU|nr:VOC family protein [Solihabitans fulvus]KAA2252698.1 VOC family protein [Solihabitans fulvus]
MTTALPGSPCWVELATSDLSASTRFYESVFGWEYEPRRDAEGVEYTVATLFGEPVAGLRHYPGEILDWTLYLAVEDLDTSIRTVRRFGGHVIEPRPHQVPGVGAKVLIDDPSGATVGLCQPAADWGFTAGVPGALVWVEFVTRKATLADRFFGRLFEFEQQQYGDGRTVDYVVWSVGGDSVVGRVRMAEGTPVDVPPRWIAHFAVDPDLGFDETLNRARRLGARLRFKPYTSSLGRVAVLSDPVGTRFAIIDPALADDWDLGSAADDPYDD